VEAIVPLIRPEDGPPSPQTKGEGIERKRKTELPSPIVRGEGGPSSGRMRGTIASTDAAI
jgi:hypothetical protein